MAELSVVLVDLDEPASLYKKHPDGESRRHGCFVQLDLGTGEMSCGYNPELDDESIPQSVELHRVLWWSIPCLTAAAANKLMEEIAPLAVRILTDSQVDDDGVGHLGEDAAEADTLIAKACADEFWEDDQVEAHSASSWLADAGVDAGIDALVNNGLTADSTDAEIEELAVAVLTEAQGCSSAGYVVINDLADWIAAARETLRDRANA